MVRICFVIINEGKLLLLSIKKLFVVLLILFVVSCVNIFIVIMFEFCLFDEEKFVEFVFNYLFMKIYLDKFVEIKLESIWFILGVSFLE